MSGTLLLHFISLLHAVLAATTVTTYADSDCTQGLWVFTPPENGKCQEDILGNYSSIRITNPTPSCNVSWHVNDYPNCAGNSAGQLQIDFCYDLATLAQLTPNFGQFTVDCDPFEVVVTAYSAVLSSSALSSGTAPTNAGAADGGTPTVTASTASSATPTDGPSSSPSPTARPEDGGLSTGAKVGIGVSVGGLVATVLGIWVKIHFHRKETNRGNRTIELEEETRIRAIAADFRDKYRFWFDYVVGKGKSATTNNAANLEAGDGIELQPTVART